MLWNYGHSKQSLLKNFKNPAKNIVAVLKPEKYILVCGEIYNTLSIYNTPLWKSLLSC